MAITYAGMMAMPPDITQCDPASVGSLTDADLISRVKARDHNAFEELLHRHFDAAFKLAARMLGRPHEAEDIAQDVFLKLWQRPEIWQPGKAKFSTWLYRVTANASIDRMRRKSTMPIEAALELADEGAGPESLAHDAQVAQRVALALDNLPPRQKLAINLTHYQGCTNRESAAIMDLSVDALESLLSRARRSLRRDLAQDWRVLLAPAGQE